MTRVGAWFSAHAQRIADAFVILVVVYVVLTAIHPSLLLSGTTITGGDTGAHVATPLYMRQHLGWGSLTSWYPGWFDGIPLYTYYFVLPDVLAAVVSYVISYAVAFKIVTILGSVLLPVGAYVMGRLFRAPSPVPAALAAATLPFLFDGSFTIDGGNLFSTLAGEYSFSLSLALSLVTIGLFARGIATRRGRWTAAVFLSLTLAAHLLPWLYALVVGGVLLVLELVDRRGYFHPDRERRAHDDRRSVWFMVSTGLFSAGLSAWWLLPFATSQSYANSMGYTNDATDSFHAIFTQLGWYNASGGAAGDRWVIVLAFAALIASFVWRDRLGITVTLAAAVSLVAYVVDPQSAIWNERLIPFWYISIYLSAGWLVGASLARFARSWPAFSRWLQGRVRWLLSSSRWIVVASWSLLTGHRDRVTVRPRFRADHGALFESDVSARHDRVRRVTRFTYVVAALAIVSTVPGLVPQVGSVFGVTPGANQVSSWAAWNYSGYESKAAWPEYHGIITTMERVAATSGCGRTMWEYNSSESRFGTTMGLMLLPYWSNNCVSSMEGLFFESSATTPYHFLNQAELSTSPSNPMVGLNYGGVDLTQGIAHLQMLGVRYYIAFSPNIVAQADRSPLLAPLAVTPDYKSTTNPTGVRWHVYQVRDAPIVTPAINVPNVVPNISSRVGWLNANEAWWLDPSQWSTMIAQSGPSSWPVRPVTVTAVPSKGVRVTTLSMSSVGIHLTVDHTGVPITLRVGPFPRWVPNGAVISRHDRDGTLVVVPSARQVTLAFGDVAEPTTAVSHVIVADQSLSFDVGRLGVPVLVKVSYYPRWHVTGASGPYRVSPNLMVVVPSAHHVSLVYGEPPSVTWGNLVTDLTVLALVVALWRRRSWRRPARVNDRAR